MLNIATICCVKQILFFLGNCFINSINNNIQFVFIGLIIFTVTANQIERLYSRFTSLDRGDLGTLSREDLLRIPELAINPLGERIVDLFHTDSGNICDRINFLQFMRVLSKFRLIRPNKENKQNNAMEKVKCNTFCFSWENF